MLTAGRDGGLKSLEVLGMLSIRIADENFGRIKLAIQVLCNFCISRQIVLKNCSNFFIFLIVHASFLA